MRVACTAPSIAGACCTTLAMLAAPGLAPAAAQSAESPPAVLVVLGKGLDAWLAQAHVGPLRERLVAIDSMSAFGTPVVPMLADLLDDPAPAVRYWSVVSLEQVLGAAAQSASPTSASTDSAIQRLSARLSDEAPIVAVAAAAALAHLGHAERSLSRLIDALTNHDRNIRLAAVTSLERLGELARPALPALHQARSDEDKYVVRIATRIINRLEGTSLDAP